MHSRPPHTPTRYPPLTPWPRHHQRTSARLHRRPAARTAPCPAHFVRARPGLNGRALPRRLPPTRRVRPCARALPRGGRTSRPTAPLSRATRPARAVAAPRALDQRGTRSAVRCAHAGLSLRATRARARSAVRPQAQAPCRSARWPRSASAR
eukprot:5507073-Prymnesium_polylepis.1